MCGGGKKVLNWDFLERFSPNPQVQNIQSVWMEGALLGVAKESVVWEMLADPKTPC